MNEIGFRLIQNNIQKKSKMEGFYRWKEHGTKKLKVDHFEQGASP